MKQILSIVFIALLVTSCAKKKAEKQAETDKEIIQNYISDNNLTAKETGSGLFYVINEVGTGASCDFTSTVRVAYKGYFTDGGVFDESSEEGISFGLQSVIKGWTEGIPYFKEGGDGILLIPSALGYGTKGTGGIPGNTVLIFDVALLEVVG